MQMWKSSYLYPSTFYHLTLKLNNLFQASCQKCVEVPLILSFNKIWVWKWPKRDDPVTCCHIFAQLSQSLWQEYTFYETRKNPHQQSSLMSPCCKELVSHKSTLRYKSIGNQASLVLVLVKLLGLQKISHKACLYLQSFNGISFGVYIYVHKHTTLKNSKY